MRSFFRRKRHKKSSTSTGDGGKGDSSSTHRRHHHHHHRHPTSTGISVIQDYDDAEDDEARRRRRQNDASGAGAPPGADFRAWDAGGGAEVASSGAGKKPRKSSTHAGGQSLGLCGDDSMGVASTSRDGNYASQRSAKHYGLELFEIDAFV